MSSHATSNQLRLGDVARGRDNNLNLLRLLAASLVVTSHSFALLFGSSNYSGEPLSVLTDGRLSVGGLAVGVCFLFGGYLIAKSCETSATAGTYFRKRCLRIFPELVIVVVAITFIIGPVVSTLDVETYLKSPETYIYLRNIVLIPTHSLPGVFSNNPYPDVVNGSLWTLPVEFICYVLTYVAFRLTRFDRKKYALLCVPPLFCVAAYFLFCFPAQLSVIRAILLFWIGVTLYVYRDKIPYNGTGYAAAVPAFILLTLLGLPTVAMLVMFPPAMFFLAYGIKKWQAKLLNVELSYGIFLWGWPVGQTIVQLVQGIQLPSLILSTIFISAMLAFGTNFVASRLSRPINARAVRDTLR